MTRPALSRRWLYALNAGILVSTGGIIAVALTSSETYDKACTKKGQAYSVTVADDQFSKTTMAIQRCDTVRVTNSGSQDLHIALGKHEEHIVYPGFTEKTIAPGESLTFVGRQVGRYQMHDHLRDTAKMMLLIRERQ